MDNAKLVDAPDERVREYYARQQLRELARSIAVPINDDDVRRELRANEQPVEISNESKAERRNRLVEFLARKKLHTNAAPVAPQSARAVSNHAVEVATDVTQGSVDLLKSREQIAKFVAQMRSQKSNDAKRIDTGELELKASQAGFTRPVASVKLLPPDLAVSADWSGKLLLFRLEDSMPTVAERTLGPISSIATRPNSGAVHVASGLMDGGIVVHKLENESGLLESTRLQEHKARVASIEFHLAGSFLISGSHDKTWRLWDVEIGKCVLEQDGHAERIQTTKTSPDGSLLVSGGWDKVARVWDLRSGVSVTGFEGHACEITAAAWHSTLNESTMQLATGSADDRCLVWDLRNPSAPLNVVYAHTSTVSDMWYNAAGSHLVTSSLDSTIKLWDATDDYKLVKIFNAGSRVTCLDGHSTANGTMLAAGRWDRLVDIYQDF